jgi:hypothetical protein
VATASNLIVNGGFDTGLGGWTPSGAVEVNSSSGPLPDPAAVFGSHGQPAGASIEQTFATKVNGWYAVKFSYWAWGDELSMLHLLVAVNGDGGIGSAGIPATQAMNHYSFIFRAESSATRLTFTDITYGDAGQHMDLVLDNVSVVESVPEPPPVLGIGIGLGVVVWRVKRSSRTGAFGSVRPAPLMEA